MFLEYFMLFEVLSVIILFDPTKNPESTHSVGGFYPEATNETKDHNEKTQS